MLTYPKIYEIHYYNEKVLNEIENLPPPLVARYITLTERMKMEGSNLTPPHTKAMENGLFELRLKADKQIARVFYCTMVGKKIVMLHSFIKKTQKTPKKELRIARKRMSEVKQNDDA